MNDESLQYELTHLCNLCAAPYRDAWRGYVWAKAQVLASHDPETYAQLPALLTQALSPSPCDKDTPTNGEGLT